MVPDLVNSDRLITKTILPQKLEQTVKLNIFIIHTDPKYYDDPEKFDPARFSAENKHKLTPGTFIPFGIGNRSCIGEFQW